jgi:hypothetical protein
MINALAYQTIFVNYSKKVLIDLCRDHFFLFGFQENFIGLRKLGEDVINIFPVVI